MLTLGLYRSDIFMEIPGFVKTCDLHKNHLLWVIFKDTVLDIPVLASPWLKELDGMMLRLIF